ncbi:MAG: hypothetical protein AAGE01_06200 [Pseudomonadota bacterium]
MVIEIDDRWVARINSPMGYWAAVLSGISLSFAPLGMYLSGVALGPVAGITVATLCLVVILFCGFFHYKLAQAVMAEVSAARESPATTD